MARDERVAKPGLKPNLLTPQLYLLLVVEEDWGQEGSFMATASLILRD